MATARKWLPIVIGILVFIVIVGLGLVGACVYMLKRQVSVETLAPEAGTQQFEQLRSRFAGQRPFIELPAADSDADPVIHRELETHPTGSVQTICVRVWVPRDRHLVRVDLPMWSLRLMGNQPIHIQAGSGFGNVSLRVTAEEIDRRGPGLIIDHQERRGEHLLVWAE